MNPYLKENLSNWISEFTEGDGGQQFSKEMRSAGPFFLQELIINAVEKAGDLDDLSEKLMGEELLALSKHYQLTEAVEKKLPSYVAAFFEDLETQGRFSGGQEMALFLLTFTGRLGQQTVKRPGAKIGRNDPCPCGSGKKFKKCCQGE